ncbi:MAG: AI-2E family transporter [Lachnospiraceae bacterium]|nr:AI-2E family transporter [Lachnospiraceae bacterium]
MFRKFYDSKYTQIGAYVVLVTTIIIAISAFIDNVPYWFAILWDKIVWLVHSSKPIVIAFVAAYLLDPVADFFEKILENIRDSIAKLSNKSGDKSTNKNQNTKMSQSNSTKNGKNSKNSNGASVKNSSKTEKDIIDSDVQYNGKKSKKSVRGLAVLITVIVVLAVVSGMVSLLVISVTDNVKVVNFDDVTGLVTQYTKNIEKLQKPVMEALDKANIESAQIEAYIKDASKNVINWLKDSAQSAAKSISNITGMITSFFISMVIMIYILIDGKRISGYISKVAYAVFNEKQNNRIRGFINDADTVFSGYIRGQLMDASVMALLVSIGLSIIGVEYALIIGLFTGLGNLIPYVGPFFAYGGVIISSLLSWDLKTFIIAIIYLIVVQFVDGNIIGPRLLSSNVEVHPMLVVIFLLFGSSIGGLLGMLLAVPVGALIKVLFVRFIEKKLNDKGIVVEED